uniref:Regulatory factor X-associated protein RFXANK-binding domain-containing protein n=1 Tax=Nyssomyia neivai TaxID=330878 RepID=A0A1L8DC15_9DIPT
MSKNVTEVMANLDPSMHFPVDQKPDTIKERLNLHVKRRLQQEPHSSNDSTSSAPCSPPKKKHPPGATGASRKKKHTKEEAKSPEVKKQTREREERISSTVEILQMVLNEKKNSLLRDPEVIAYLSAAVQKASKPN